MTDGLSMHASWMALLALGAFHGLNPGMGWLFAVALGMQERRRHAVWRALLPLGIGHSLAVIAVVALAIVAGLAIPMRHLQWPVAVLLVGLGTARLIRHRHPRWAQMRVNMKGLTLWSFLMASAHGAGVMVVPLFLGMAVQAEAACHAAGTSVNTPAMALTATAIHAAGYLAITAVIAVVVYEKVGLGLLRKAWINLDLIWAVALIGTGVLTVLV
ncbi:MAG TPA: hypothetical protein VD837_19150 [Terriglobales bacterium]|nr:hypothetical protein [Terriglobales bacterium]